MHINIFSFFLQPSVFLEEPTCSNTLLDDTMCAAPSLSVPTRHESGVGRHRKRARPNAETETDVLTKSLLETAQKCFEKRIDGNDAFGLLVADRLRGMDCRMREQCERIILDCLIRGRRGELDDSSRIVTGPPPPAMAPQHTSQLSSSQQAFQPYHSHYVPQRYPYTSTQVVSTPRPKATASLASTPPPDETPSYYNLE